MGKSALFYVAAATVMFAGINAEISGSEVATSQEEANYYEQVLAREIAQSAFNILLAQTREDYATHRPSEHDVPYRQGEYDISAVGSASGPVLLRATGRLGSAQHQIAGLLYSDYESRFAALTFDGPIDYVNPRGSSWLVSGMDTEPPGSEGSGPPVNGPGVRSTVESADQIVQAAMPDDQVIGISGPGSFVVGSGPVDFSRLAEEIDTHVERVVLPGPQHWTGDRQFGSREHPIVLVVDGDLRISGGVDGYGALLVKGSFEVSNVGTPKWEGLVIVRSEGGEHGILGNTRFFGAMALQSITEDGETGGEDDAGMLGGHFDVTVFDGGGLRLYQAHQYDDRYNVSSIDLLSAGCGVEGGLCWDDAVSGSGATSVTISTVNGGVTAGNLIVETGTSLTQVSVSEPFEQTIDLADLKRLAVSFNGLCSLPGSTPPGVAGDESSRGGAYTVRIRDADTGLKLLDVSAYHHLSGSDCSPRVAGTASPFVEVEPMILDMRGNPGIYTSASALRRLKMLFPEIEPEQPRLVLRSVAETVDRPND